MKYLIHIIILIIILLIILFNNNIESFQNNDDESECKYISSHGIIKSCNKLKNIYYIKSDELNNFIIPNTNFVLVTGNEDTTIPNDISIKANEILSSPYLIHWFSQNLDSNNPKLTAIPIGLDYHSVNNENGSEWGPKESALNQEKFIVDLEKPYFDKRELLIYCNFKNTIRGRYGEKDRRDALDQIPDNLLIIEESVIKRKETFKKMASYSFVVSPLGNGLDCHRTWEALILGCIPIVKTSSLDALYNELPVLIVNEWYDVNTELLQNTINKFKTMDFNYEKLTLKYWMDKISDKIEEI